MNTNVIYTILKVMILLLCGSEVHGSEKTEMKIYQFCEEFEITPNLWCEMEDGLKIQFVSHGHKRQVINGPDSPLIVTMQYELLGKTTQEQHNIYLNKDSPTCWVWNNYNIQLVKHVYGAHMTLIINKVNHRKD